LLGDVVLDEHVVLEHGDLGAASPLAHHHGALDGLAAGEELGLGDHGAAATGVTALAAALALGLEAGRALDGLDLVARLAHLDDGVRRIIGRGALIGAAAGAATTAASPRARGAAGRGAIGGLRVVRGAVGLLALRGVVRVLRVARVLVGLVLAGAVLGVLLVLAATAAATAPATAATAPTGAAALLGVVGGGVPLGAVIRGVVGLGAGLRVAALVRPGRRATARTAAAPAAAGGLGLLTVVSVVRLVSDALRARAACGRAGLEGEVERELRLLGALRGDGGAGLRGGRLEEE